MSEEIREAVQIIEVAYDGIEIAMKVGSGGIAAMQKAIDFLKGMLDYEKSLGRTSMRKLLMKGGDLQVLEFATADMKKVENMPRNTAFFIRYFRMQTEKTERQRLSFTQRQCQEQICFCRSLAEEELPPLTII